MSFDEIAHEIAGQDERIEELDQQLSELLDRFTELRDEAVQCKRRV